ncbi:MAG TPA: class I tRNA ligase family protein, partial [Acidimicrobiales bacterium]|nr:class I tRNA ligase family protein [Acidimicrobiales bacterium]
HVLTYCGADVVGRYRRMQGRAVFQPMGFDAFGIHTENFALRLGEHPAALTERTIANYRRQLSRVGCAWDWTGVVTSDPSYYRWTQWLFVQLFRAGLAYQAEAPALWCPSCATVLAREQVEDDRCERCASPVTERVMRQWFLRITAYRDRLAAGLDGLDWPDRAKNTQRRWLEGLHDWLISRQRYWGPPIPIVHCDACGPVPVPEDQLPVLLPDVADIRPPGDGRSPLAAVESFVATSCPSCAGPGRRETDVSDTFFDSSWYFLRHPSADRHDVAWDPQKAVPVDLYAGGPEHVARHHLYARFVTMALHDLGLVGFEEPFPTLRLHGTITKDGAKMSKSRGNVVNPDGYVDRHGADVLRVHLLSSGRWSGTADFADAGIAGIERLFTRLWRLAADEADGPGAGGPALARAAARVAAGIEAMRFNNAMSALREVANRASSEEAPTVILLLAPLAPYLAEELWAAAGGTYSVHTQPWPAPAAAGGPPGTRTLVVQVDGRVRARLPAPVGLPAGEARRRAEGLPEVARSLRGRQVDRVVHVPDRLLNFVTFRR